MSKFCATSPGRKVSLPIYNKEGKKIGEYVAKRKSGAVIAALKSLAKVPRYRKIKNGNV